MNNPGNTIFFWVAFSILTPLILRHFYYKKNKDIIFKMRLTTGITEAISLCLLAWTFLENITIFQVIILILLLINMLLLICSKKLLSLKIAATLHIAATISLFIIMYQMYPGTIVLGAEQVPTIISALLLLSGNVSALLMWDQLQKQARNS